MKVYQGQRAILNCRARASPAPLIKWANGGDGALPLARDDRYKITRSNSLLIEHTNMSDSGTYHCIASNDLETKSRLGSANNFVGDFLFCFLFSFIKTHD